MILIYRAEVEGRMDELTEILLYQQVMLGYDGSA